MQCREAVRMDRSMEAVVAMEQRELEVQHSLAHCFGHTYKHGVAHMVRMDCIIEAACYIHCGTVQP